MRQVLQLNIIIMLHITNIFQSYVGASEPNSYRELTDHTMVTDNGVFPFVAAILVKSMYLSAGALINDFWVLTAADSLYMIRESTRIMRVRLGSVNNKKGGRLYPVKTVEIHPNFDDSSPQFDIALVLLPRRVRFTENLSPIKLQPVLRHISATHFIVNAWPPHVIPTNIYRNHTESLDVIKRRRMMTVSHLHPSTKDNCSKELAYFNISAAGSIMCLEPAIGTDPCVPQKATTAGQGSLPRIFLFHGRILPYSPRLAGGLASAVSMAFVLPTLLPIKLEKDRNLLDLGKELKRDVGAPVVLNGILWGIMSSWKPEECALDPGPIFVTLVAARNISTWIQSTIRGHVWNYTPGNSFQEDYDEYDYSDVES